MKKYEKREW
jgi:replication factor A1